MPPWSEIQEEMIKSAREGGPPNFDDVRRKYLLQYSELVDRDVILYISGFTHTATPTPQVAVVEQDIHALMEATYGLRRKKLDLFLHSPGGSIDVAKSFCTYLRDRFDHIRAVIPHLAMSAATMIACCSDEIVMGRHSSMGPIDPQLTLNRGGQVAIQPATAILLQFEKIRQLVNEDHGSLSVCYPLLECIGPDLLIQCEQAIKYSEEIVADLLAKHMLSNDLDKARSIAGFLAKYEDNKSHGRHFSRKEMQDIGLKIVPLEDDQSIQDAVLSVYHACMLTVQHCQVSKLVENQHGRAYIL